jgi:hypothetical protein
LVNNGIISFYFFAAVAAFPVTGALVVTLFAAGAGGHNG